MIPSPFQRPTRPEDSSLESEKKPSLLERLETLREAPAQPPQPKPFHMSEPFQQHGGIWCFWLTADEPVLDYVGHLHCIINITAMTSHVARGRVLFGISPRYEYEEAWMWVYRLLETETRSIDLGDVWLKGLGEDEDDFDFLG